MNLKDILNADMTTLSRWWHQGFDWWIGEIRALLPGSLLGSSGKLQAFHRLGPDGQIIAATDRSADTLIIPPDMCFVRHLRLPPMREADLLSLVTLDTDRIMPIAAHEIVLGAQRVGATAADGLVDVVVGGLPLVRARAIAQALEAAQLAPAHIGPLAQDDGNSLAFDLAAGMRQAGLLPVRPQVARFWWIAAAALLLANLGIATLRDQQQVNHLQDLVDAQSTALGAVRRIEARLQENTASIDRLRARRAKQQPQRLLVTLNTVLPERCWAQRLEWDGARVRVAGYCAQDVNPVRAVKASGAFASVRASRAEALAQTFSGTPFDFNASLDRSR